MPSRKSLDPKITFGVEIELSIPQNSRSVLDQLRRKGINCAELSRISNQPDGVWKVTHDGSIQCPCHDPNCQTRELVSPILRGGKGLMNLHQTLQSVNALDLSLNKSMGVHVHVGMSKFKFGAIRRICQQFVRFEYAFDEIVPPSRRGDENKYTRSNRNNPRLSWHEGGGLVAAIGRCGGMEELRNLVSPDRYYKLNLHSFLKHRTLEFRQHSATTDYTKLSNWIRLLVGFCKKARMLPAPEDDGTCGTLPMLLDFVGDPLLKSYYLGRAEQLELVRRERKRTIARRKIAFDSDSDSDTSDEYERKAPRTTLAALQEIIRNLDIEGDTSSVNQCKERLKGVYIAIGDYVAGRYHMVCASRSALRKRILAIGPVSSDDFPDKSLKHLLTKVFYR